MSGVGYVGSQRTLNPHDEVGAVAARVEHTAAGEYLVYGAAVDATGRQLSLLHGHHVNDGHGREELLRPTRWNG